MTQVERVMHQDLPANGAEREALRHKGQFWTPDWVADAMVEYVAQQDRPIVVFDPAVGAGAFFRAAKRIAEQHGTSAVLSGRELHEEVLQEATISGLDQADLSGVDIRDFILDPPAGPIRGVVANPPYIRHHRIPAETKAHLKSLSTRLMGAPLDGRTGLHVFFLIQSLELLASGGRLAFILPSDVCEGVFATQLWGWIAANFCIHAVATFEPEATPFPGVDTNAFVLFAENSKPAGTLKWARIRQRGRHFQDWVRAGFPPADAAVEARERQLAEAIKTGLTRHPQDGTPSGKELNSFAKVLRGIATGANEFFFMTRETMEQLAIPEEYCVRAVGRTRDVAHDTLTMQDLEALDSSGRPTHLLSLDKQPLEELPPAIQTYLATGENLGLPRRALIAQRRPWYKMEKRAVPPILFAYLGRRNTRFIWNQAGAVPLTGFLCVYPNVPGVDAARRLFSALNDPETIANLPLVAKSYGGGAIKVEPRGLERLTVPDSVIKRYGL